MYIMINICLFFGLGVGLFSCNYFIFTILAGYPDGWMLMTAEFVIFAALIFLFPYLKGPAVKTEHSPDKTFSVIFYLMLFFNILSFISVSLMNPHGGWDAWAIWNLRARFLFLGNNLWTQIFSPLIYWSRFDYPMLLPCFVASIWVFFGKTALLVPIVASFIFTFFTVALALAALSIFRGRIYGLLGGIVLLCTQFFFYIGAAQYSDVPLSFYILAAIVTLFLYDNSDKKDFKILILSGIMVSMAAWTKDEGILFLLAIGAGRLFAGILINERKKALKEAFYFGIGIFPVLCVVIFFKMMLSFSNINYSYLKITSGLSLAFIKISDFSRSVLILKEGIKEILNMKHWNLFPLILPLSALFAGISIGNKFKTSIYTSFFALIAVVLGYFCVYLVTPWDLQWHLSTSVSRLIVHLWPAAIFVFFMIVGKKTKDT